MLVKEDKEALLWFGMSVYPLHPRGSQVALVTGEQKTGQTLSQP